MSLLSVTVDIQRDTATATAGGGETLTTATPYTSLSCTIGYPDKSSVYRNETSGRGTMGPGTRTRSDRVAYFDPWDGTTPTISINDRVVPNPAKAWLPTSMKVVAVRPYFDYASGELQLDLEDLV